MTELPEQFDLGDLCVDLGLQRVQRGATPIPLPKLSFDLLIALARSAPKLVSIDDLMTRVWPGLVVNPETVGQRVKLLRDALGDDARAPKYVESLRGRGYRLAVPVTAVAPVDVAPIPVAIGQIAAIREPLEALIEPAASVVEPIVVQMPSAALPVPRTGTRRWAAAVVALVLVATLGGLFFYWITARRPHEAVPAATQVTLKGAPLRTVAVMPFEDLSFNHDNGQLAQALPEMVLQRLGMVNDLVVIARSSSFAFIGQHLDSREIGRRLDARFLVQGALQRVGETLRVTAQLVDAQSGRQVQALQFDRTLAQIFDLQDEIATQLATALKVQLLGADMKRVDRSQGTSLEAYLSYLQSQALLNRWIVADAQRAIAELEHAIKLDPGFALAYAELARARYIAAWLRAPGKDTKGLPEMLNLANKAVLLDPQLGEAYSVRGMMQSQMHAPAAAVVADFRKGIELAPNYGPGYEMFGEVLNDLDQRDEALAMFDRSILIDPVAPRNIYYKAMRYFEDGNTPLAEQFLLRALEVAPEFPPAYVRLAQMRWATGNIPQAIKLVEQALRFETQSEFVNDQACAMYLDIGDRRAAGSVSAGAPPDSDRAIMLATWDRNYRAVNFRRGIQSFASDMAAHAYYVSVEHNVVEQGDMAAMIAKLREELGFTGDGAGFVLRPDAEPGDAMVLAYLFKSHGDSNALANIGAAFEKAVAQWSMPSEDVLTDVLMLLGRQEEALAAWSKLIHRGHWPPEWVFERDPILDEARNDPTYLQLVDLEHSRMAEQRIVLEQMRQAGEVPRR